MNTPHRPPPQEAPPAYLELRERLHEALGPDRKSLLIGLDGRDGAGKSSLAAWLSWQLGMSAVYLDLFMRQGRPVSWRTDDLQRAIDSRLGRDPPRPLIVEGILLLK